MAFSSVPKPSIALKSSFAAVLIAAGSTGRWPAASSAVQCSPIAAATRAACGATGTYGPPASSGAGVGAGGGSSCRPALQGTSNESNNSANALIGRASESD